MRKFIVTAFSALLAFSASAIAQPKEVLLGALLPLTGPAAPIGIEEQQGVQFAIDQINARGGINGVPVKILFDDSQGKPDQAVLAFNRMIDLNGVPALLTAFSSISLAIAPLATRREVLVVNPAAQTDKLENASPFLVNTIPLVRQEASVLAKYAIEHVGKKAAIIYENAAAGIDGSTDFRKYFQEAGGEIIAEEPVEFGQTNYRSTLLKIAAAKPDFVYIAITQSHEAMADQVGQIPDFPTGIGNTFSRPFFGHASTEGWYQTAIQSGYPDEATVAAFKKQFNAEDMGFFAREYFNSTNIILKAAKKVIADGGDITGPALRDAVLAIRTFESPVADVTFESNTASRPVEILQYKGKERVIVETARSAD
ncbi:ABC transporter substrate-binding protein [Mesorhizobium sp. YC-39]|uniref:ABC transporter substrate-binding protein n=1 Tax=unclassified Mesorhizobium TaxID=325217 RepID=UPI0021E7DD13|nr:MULTISPECIES: ABC transporter substrate-binding protein [unclassified Mesorhizobium]MCV3205633.1 ABC transporter substrate-binding protein [Mesorhizobium sp. YC-2]MCV3227968.1 ABC transporter substrate-binding protein [Mesorhizobium sp. YC-39]